MAEVKQTRSQMKRIGSLPRTPPNELWKEKEGLLDPPSDPKVPNPKITPIDTKGKETEIKPPKSFMSQFFDAEERVIPKSLTGFEEYTKSIGITLELGRYTKKDQEED